MEERARKHPEDMAFCLEQTAAALREGKHRCVYLTIGLDNGETTSRMFERDPQDAVRRMYLALRTADVPSDAVIVRPLSYCRACKASCWVVRADAPRDPAVLCHRCFGVAPAEFEAHLRTITTPRSSP